MKNNVPIPSPIQRFSSRRQRLDHTFLAPHLKGAQHYDRIAGYFSSSLLELVGEALETVTGKIRVVCNSDLHPQDVKTAKAAQMAIRRAWTTARPESLLKGEGEPRVRERFERLYHLLSSGKLEVKVLPDQVFGLIHGKAGVITLADGAQICFVGSANESKSAWRLNYELVWADASPEAVAWVQEEFDALWSDYRARPLAEAVIQDLKRLAHRRVIHVIDDWLAGKDGIEVDPAAAIIETPVYRDEVGLWEHQKYFVKLVFEAHQGATKKARLVLADQVGLGKTLQLAMSAQLIALAGTQPIVVLCPKTLLWQWQAEMRDLLAMPSAVWDGRCWVDEQGYKYPALGPEGIVRCPRRVGIVSSGLISYGAEAAQNLLRLKYDCVILDEAHRARRQNLGQNRDHEPAEPNNLLRFIVDLAERSRSVLLATATPVQLRPIEAWDLLDILSRGDESVLGNGYSKWRRGGAVLDMIMRRTDLPTDESEQWEWARNPLPPKEEHNDFLILRRSLGVLDDRAVISGNLLDTLSRPDRSRFKRLFPRLVEDHNPFIRRIVRRTRQQLEETLDLETGEPLLKRIKVELLGEGPDEAIPLPGYLRQAYNQAEQFCDSLGKGSGFLKTLLLRRVGSSIYAGLITAQRLLGGETDFDSEEDNEAEDVTGTIGGLAKQINSSQQELLESFIANLHQYLAQEQDPKYTVVLDCLQRRGWLERGCIIFSQYRDSIQWLTEQLTQEFPEEPIALYSGPTTSGIMRGGQWEPTTRETLKQLVRQGELRLMLGTDAASEGLNLQSLGTLINLDLPWNPTRLEQRKGRIQRIGQINETVYVYNMRYQDSVEDRVHELLSNRLQDIYNLFGQLPDVLEDAWVAMAVGDKARAQKIIEAVPDVHPFQLRYTAVNKVEWETCEQVLDAGEKWRVLSQGWG